MNTSQKMITVDWSIGASPINYITARNRVGDHARWVAEFVDFLHLHNFVRFQELHAIGHSLGGQMVGLIGKAVTRGRIQVIYPLDPGKINIFCSFKILDSFFIKSRTAVLSR